MKLRVPIPNVVILSLAIFQFVMIIHSERITLDKKHLWEGAPIDYSYNETWSSSSSPSSFQSAPGCPKSDAGYPWLLFGNPSPKCYRVGIQGPCPDNTVLHLNRSSPFGKCDFERKTLCTSTPIIKHSDRFSFCWHTGCFVFVYDREKNQVHHLYSQGPCAKTEWLQHDGNGGLKCARRLCHFHNQGLSAEADMKLQTNGSISQNDISCCDFLVVMPAFANSLGENSCPSNRVYSPHLKRCVERFEDSGLIIG